MGDPAPPLTLLLLLLLCLAAPSSPCFTLEPNAPADLNLSNRSRHCAELDWGIFRGQTRLRLRHDGIETLAPSSRVEPVLEELDLSYNRLRELPAGFFANATALRRLQLEGNPLTAVPRSAFQPSLRHLVVPCRCDVVGSVLAPCTCAQPGCAVPWCQCFASHHGPFNVTDFHSQQCRGSAGLVAGLTAAAGVVVVLLLVAAVVYHRRRKAGSVGWGERKPATAQGQPHYISRASEIGAAGAGGGAAGAGGGAAPDYENVFVSPCSAPAAARGWTPSWQEQQYR